MSRLWRIIPLPEGSPRDRRMMLALVFLAGAGVAMTLIEGAIVALFAFKAWPWAMAPLLIRWLGWLGLAQVAVIFTVVSGFSFVLGRRQYRMKGGRDGLELEAEGGDQEQTVGPAGAQA